MSKLRRTLSVLEAIEARYELTPGENEALQFNKKRTLRELALENGKEKLLNRDFDGARRAFGEARKLRTGWKVVLVAVGLVVAPRILCGIYQRREQKHRRPA